MDMYTGYDFWAESYYDQLSDDILYEGRLAQCHARLTNRTETLDEVKEDRTHAYGLFDREREDIHKRERRNTLKLVLGTTGGAAVGIVVGTLIVFLKTQ